jgi:hypothetical protein
MGSGTLRQRRSLIGVSTRSRVALQRQIGQLCAPKLTSAKGSRVRISAALRALVRSLGDALALWEAGEYVFHVNRESRLAEVSVHEDGE